MLLTPKSFKDNKIKQDFFENLITNGVEEDIHLDYKREIDNSNAEVAKDFSAFANTDGGIIIYGMDEDKNKPSEIVPIIGVGLKEKIDQIAHNGIAPPLNVRIWPTDVDINGSKGQLFVVYIPRKYPNLHFAKKRKRYYTRTNFTSTPMEQHEIELAFQNRKNFTAKIEEKVEESIGIFKGLMEPHHLRIRYIAYPLDYGKKLFKVGKDMNEFFLNSIPETPKFKIPLYRRRSRSDLPKFSQGKYYFKSEKGFHNVNFIVKDEGIIIFELFFDLFSENELIELSNKIGIYLHDEERIKRGICFGERIFDVEIIIDNFLGFLKLLECFYEKVEYFEDIHIQLNIKGIPHWKETIKDKLYQEAVLEPVEHIYNVEYLYEDRIEIARTFFTPIFNGFGILDSELDWLYSSFS